MREEVGDGVVAGAPKPIDNEPGFGNELGLRKIAGDWGERGVIGEKREGERWRWRGLGRLVLRE